MAAATLTSPLDVLKTRLQSDFYKSQLSASRAARGVPPLSQLSFFRTSLLHIRETFQILAAIPRAEGVRGLYRGLSASYLGVTESTLQWVLYERMKKYIAENEQYRVVNRQRTSWDDAISWSYTLGAAGSAKFFAALVTYPHEVVRTRLRQAPVTTSGTGVPHLKYTGLVQCFKLVWKEEGMAALYGGLVPHMLRVVPSAAIMFGVYEAVLKALGPDSAPN